MDKNNNEEARNARAGYVAAMALLQSPHQPDMDDELTAAIGLLMTNWYKHQLTVKHREQPSADAMQINVVIGDGFSKYLYKTEIDTRGKSTSKMCQADALMYKVFDAISARLSEPSGDPATDPNWKWDIDVKCLYTDKKGKTRATSKQDVLTGPDTLSVLDIARAAFSDGLKTHVPKGVLWD